MVSIGGGSFTYEVTGENWGDMPEIGRTKKRRLWLWIRRITSMCLTGVHTR